MKNIRAIVLLIAVITAGGCGSLLPSSKETVKSPWESFEAVKAAYDQIIPHVTTRADLSNIGFDPFETPNIEILTYLNIIQNFMPNPSIKKKDLPNGLQDCISSHESCTGYEFYQKKLRDERHGSVVADLFGFKRKVHSTGWEFRALIVMHDDVVVYKVWGGKPQIDTTRKQKKPLGPLQKLDDVIINTAF